jgi:hypothetical protein
LFALAPSSAQRFFNKYRRRGQRLEHLIEENQKINFGVKWLATYQEASF